MEVYYKMSRPHTSQFEEETSKIDTEYNIQIMESELEYHRKLSKVYENSLLSEQKQLSRIQKRLNRHNQMQNHIRDALRETREDDSE